jgi:transcriptional regulator with XRE-family HTH domain
MKERIRQLRKNLGLNQTEFGRRIGVKQTTIAGYETGSKNPMDAVLTAICREFDVREEWLKTGKGKMFIERSRSETIAEFMGELLKDEDDSFRKRLIEAMASWDKKDWEDAERLALTLSGGKKES